MENTHDEDGIYDWHTGKILWTPDPTMGSEETGRQLADTLVGFGRAGRCLLVLTGGHAMTVRQQGCPCPDRP